MKTILLAICCAGALLACDSKTATSNTGEPAKTEGASSTATTTAKTTNTATAKTPTGDAKAPTPPAKTAVPTLTKEQREAANKQIQAAIKKAGLKTAGSKAGSAAGAKKSLPAPSDVAATPADAKKSASGLAWKVLKAGAGTVNPKATDKVKVHYTGWTTDGKMFDSSVVRGTPATFPLNGVIKGWTEGVALMVEGEKRRFWIPGNLAYGDKPRRPGAPSGTLVFDVELISIEKAPVATQGDKAAFKAFVARFKKAADEVCACKDKACAEAVGESMRKTPPPKNRPTPEQMKVFIPLMQRLQTCGAKLGLGGPAPKGAPIQLKGKPGAKK